MNDRRAQLDSEKSFFKNAQTFYAAELDVCGSIKKSMSQLKTRLARSGAKVSVGKWARLDSPCAPARSRAERKAPRATGPRPSSGSSKPEGP